MKSLAIIVALAATPALSQTQCAGTDQVAELLAANFGEVVQGLGLDASGNMMMVWANVATGTWTITASTPAGMTCVIGAGEYYQAINSTPGVPG